MKISPLYEALVELEENPGLKKESFDEIFKNKSRGVIGKMEAMGLVNKSEDMINLSKKGHQYLNNILDILHNPIPRWNNKWTIVSFSIPEKKRGVRDKFRRYIESLGMKPLFNSFWVSPLDLCDDIEKYINDHDISENVAYLIADKIMGINRESIIDIWDFEKYRELYENFIEETEQLLRDAPNNKQIKRQILKFALLINDEPKLPLELMPKDWPRFRANLYYKKLRNRLRAK